MITESLMTSLRKLRLSGLAGTLDVRLQEAAGNRLNHAEFLELIVADELLIRQDRQVGRVVYLKKHKIGDTVALPVGKYIIERNKGGEYTPPESVRWIDETEDTEC